MGGATPDTDGADRQKLQRDAALLRRVADGDRAAQLELVRALSPRVRRMAHHMSPYPDEVDDLVQEVLIQILRAAPRFQAEGCVEAWADVIAVRTILRRLRGLHRLKRLFVGETPAVEPVTPEPGGDEALIRRRRAQRLTALLAELPPPQRMALVLKVVLGHPRAEVAARMGRPEDSVRYLLRKGRERLRTRVEQDPMLAELLAGSEV